ncbi:unnamed protein product [Nyctereutes procyonoides]|uniref:(raccoon dog) hypothetical protein n=1 Tax=Nyctereutes procyonoides TaxID=34880 RepID=A0A811ZH98_NYCPR|nr:unnamed protein product [Nyctereutes procyonoides]
MDLESHPQRGPAPACLDPKVEALWEARGPLGTAPRGKGRNPAGRGPTGSGPPG